jgi:hypothetical protein
VVFRPTHSALIPIICANYPLSFDAKAFRSPANCYSQLIIPMKLCNLGHAILPTVSYHGI